MADDVRDKNAKSSESHHAEENEVVDDLTILSLSKDSITVCELCGRVGRRENFYARNSRFCSLRCSASNTRRRFVNWKFMMEGSERLEGYIPLEPLPQLQTWPATLHDLQAGPIKQPLTVIANSYEWNDELFGCDFLAAPVSLFKHAPLHDIWENTFEGMKVEVKNTDCEGDDKTSDYFWVATVIKVKGYMGLFRYEGFGSDTSHDFWVNLCCPEARPVGWCATRGKPLIPPKSIQDKYNDWKKFLVKQLTGARTLPANFYTKLADNLKSRFSVGTIMEVVDKNRISQVKVASVYEIVGKRLHVKYYDSSPDDNGFWCHEDSPLIHPVGWAFRVGHRLDAPPTYCQRVAAGRLLPNDATLDMFYKYPNMEPPLFAEGMKLEAIDPLNLSAICAATVMQILNEGYMMIRIDCYPPDAAGADWFCYHQRSPCIFPVGFSAANNINIVPPSGWTLEEFTWSQYISTEGCHVAPATSFAARTHVVHGFVAGMRLECADLMDPRLVCVATIARVVADLLKVHFDGWGDEYDQWLWAHSTDMYPVGWCRAVGHRLEGPLPPQPRPPRPPKQQKHARRPKLKRGRVKRHNTGPSPQNVNQPTTTEESSQNSDIADTKSFSPPTSASETSADVEVRQDEAKMDVDMVAEKQEVPSLPQDFPKEVQEEMVLEHKPAEEVETDQREAEVLEHSVEPSPMEDTNDKFIPRLVNNATVPQDVMNIVDPENWTEADVSRFLTVNDCQPYCINFANITGKKMLQLSKDEIIELLEMKVGPSLKIFDLIKQLKCKIKTPQSRLLSNFK